MSRAYEKKKAEALAAQAIAYRLEGEAAELAGDSAQAAFYKELAKGTDVLEASYLAMAATT